MRLIVASLLVVLAAALAVVYTLNASAGSPPTIRAVPTTLDVDYDAGTFDVRVQLSNFNHQGQVGYDDDRDTIPDRFASSIGLGAFEAEFTFNSGLLEVVRVEPGNVFDGSVRNPQCLEREPVPGRYAIGCVTFGTDPGPQGGGLLATFTFRPLANGSTQLALDAQLGGPLGDSVAVTSVGAVVQVSGAPRQAPTPTPTTNAPPNSGPGGPTPAGPSVIGGGTPGALGPMVTPGPNSPTGAPGAGTGYEPPDATMRPLLIGAGLAAAGFVMLAAGSRLALRRRD